jgi:hypothetical protein
LLILKQLKHAREILLSRPIRPNERDATDLLFNHVPPVERAALFARVVPSTARFSTPWRTA